MNVLKGEHKYIDRKLVIEYVPIRSINPNVYNPNVHNPVSFDLLTKSVSYFGFTQPIVVRRETMEIIDGENRWRVAAVLNMPKVPVCFVSMSDTEMRIATLIHNRARGRESTEAVEKIEGELNEEQLNVLLLKDRK